MDEPACPYCGLIRPGLHQLPQVLFEDLLGSDPVRTIIYINIAFYFLSLLLDPQGIWLAAVLLVFCRPSNQSLFLLGASGTPSVIKAHRFWTLISASFLHGRNPAYCLST